MRDILTKYEPGALGVVERGIKPRGGTFIPGLSVAVVNGVLESTRGKPGNWLDVPLLQLIQWAYLTRMSEGHTQHDATLRIADRATLYRWLTGKNKRVPGKHGKQVAAALDRLTSQPFMGAHWTADTSKPDLIASPLLRLFERKGEPHVELALALQPRAVTELRKRVAGPHRNVRGDIRGLTTIMPTPSNGLLLTGGAPRTVGIQNRLYQAILAHLADVNHKAEKPSPLNAETADELLDRIGCTWRQSDSRYVRFVLGLVNRGLIDIHNGHPTCDRMRTFFEYKHPNSPKAPLTGREEPPAKKRTTTTPVEPAEAPEPVEEPFGERLSGGSLPIRGTEKRDPTLSWWEWDELNDKQRERCMHVANLLELDPKADATMSLALDPDWTTVEPCHEERPAFAAYRYINGIRKNQKLTTRQAMDARTLYRKLESYWPKPGEDPIPF